VTITAASIDTHVAKRDNDLRSARHLDTDAYPAITFASTLVTEHPGSRWQYDAELRSDAESARLQDDFYYVVGERTARAA
jgi:polyisoprenoid-binding protein YceI